MGKSDEMARKRDSRQALIPVQLREGANSTVDRLDPRLGFGNLTPAAFASFASQGSSPRSASLEAQSVAENSNH